MTRRHFIFDCAGTTLAATLDDAPGTTGLLIVSGGNEIRSGAWNSQAQLAARMAAHGYPVLRFDRRGIGDSEGDNAGFRHSAEDIAAALAAFRHEAPQLHRVVAFGNCDAASALMLGGGFAADALVLANPWTIERDDAPPPPAALRAHYLQRLKDPRALLRLVSGKISLRGLMKSLGDITHKAEPTSLAGDIATGLGGFSGPVTILIAERDRTAQTFMASWNRADPRLRSCPGASHSFVEPSAREWLDQQVLTALSD